MNKDSLFFFVFMICAMIYMVAAQRVRRWSDKKKRSRAELQDKPPVEPASSTAANSRTEERSHTIREILKRAAEGALVPVPAQEKEMPPLPAGRRISEQFEERRPVRPPPVPWTPPPLPLMPGAKGAPRKIVPPTARPTPSASLTRIQTALRQSKSVRDAVILSEILQPPKGMR